MKTATVIKLNPCLLAQTVTSKNLYHILRKPSLKSRKNSEFIYVYALNKSSLRDCHFVSGQNMTLYDHDGSVPQSEYSDRHLRISGKFFFFFRIENNVRILGKKCGVLDIDLQYVYMMLSNFSCRRWRS